MKKPKIIYPVYDGDKLIKDGSIDGVPLKKIWEQCQKEAEEYVKNMKRRSNATTVAND